MILSVAHHDLRGKWAVARVLAFVCAAATVRMAMLALELILLAAAER